MIKESIEQGGNSIRIREKEYIQDSDRPSELLRANNQVNTLCLKPDDTEEIEKANIYWQREEWCNKEKVDLKFAKNKSAHTTRQELASLEQRVIFSCAK